MAKLLPLPDWTARIILRTRTGILAVRQGNDEWHLPGGKKNPGEVLPLSTAKRELTEETGIPHTHCTFRHRRTRPSKQGKRNKYDIHYFEAHCDDALVDSHRASHGIDGEETRIITYAELRTTTGFNTAQLNMLRKLRCLRPPNMSSRHKRQRV